MATLLLNKGANSGVKDKNGQIPLHYAAANNALKVAEILIKHNDSEVNAKDKFRKTPHQLAMEKNYSEMQKLLLISGANTSSGRIRIPLMAKKTAKSTAVISTPLSLESRDDFEVIESETHFSKQQISKLNEKFNNAMTPPNSSNTINLEQFQKLLDIEDHDFAEHIFAAFDSDKKNAITFFEFCNGLSTLSGQTQIESRAEFCFKVYDIDESGFIDKFELTSILTQIVKKYKLPEQMVQPLIDTTYSQMDANGDNEISYPEFLATATKNKILLEVIPPQFIESLVN